MRSRPVYRRFSGQAFKRGLLTRGKPTIHQRRMMATAVQNARRMGINARTVSWANGQSAIYLRPSRRYNAEDDDEEDEEEMSKRVTNPGQDASGDFLPGGRITFDLTDEETRRQIRRLFAQAGIELSDDYIVNNPQRILFALGIDDSPTAASVRWVRLPPFHGGTRHNVEDVTWHPLGRIWLLEGTDIVAVEVMRMQDAADAGISVVGHDLSQPGFIWAPRGDAIAEMGADDPRKGLRD